MNFCTNGVLGERKLRKRRLKVRPSKQALGMVRRVGIGMLLGVVAAIQVPSHRPCTAGLHLMH